MPWRLDLDLDGLVRPDAAPVTVIGSGFVDRVLAVPRLPVRGEDLVIAPPHAAVGGCGVNVARGLRRLGVPVVAGVPLGGGPNGRMIGAALAALGLRSPLAVAEGDNGVCYALVEPDGERTFLTVPGVEQALTADDLARLPPPAGWVYLSGYEAFGGAGEAVLDWLEAAGARGVLVDGGPRVARLDGAVCARLAALGAVLSVNAREAALVDLDGRGAPRSAAALARAAGLTVIVRLGARGAQVARPGEAAVAIPCPSVAVRDTIGAGDAHAAGTLAGLSAGCGLVEAAALGCVVGALSVTRAGPDGAPTRAEVQRFVSASRSG